MKLKQVFAWMCILLVSVNAYAVEIQTTTTTKKIPPSVLAQLKNKPPLTTQTTTLPLKTPIQPATGYTPEQADAQGYVPPPPKPEQIPPDRSSGDPKCPEDGYYCMARLGGTSIWCQLGTAPESYGVPDPKDCNTVANYCRAHPEDTRYCK